MMSDKEICFIACVNNDLFFEECKMYIERLYVPEGYEVEVLAVYDAESMTSGYNEAMHASDAKYKIYLHQDVFIVDRYFLYELLDIFNLDSSIKMVGTAGPFKLPENGVMWDNGEYMRIYSSRLNDVSECDVYSTMSKKSICYVEAIDGLLMATATDVEWRDDLFKNFDFYDASQSMEFLKRGYNIVIPIVNKPICVHDDGYILNLINYEDNRKIFMNEYGEFIKSIHS